jgi:formylglycine-generating enzyme required for sulfatase activity/energy-coupling factor transporter ATP-binding protein EcfA2
MLGVLLGIFATCVSLLGQPGGDLNQVRPPDPNGLSQQAQAVEPNQPGSKAEQTTHAQDTGTGGFDWTKCAAVIIAAAGFGFGVYQYVRRRTDAATRKTAELGAEAVHREAQQLRTAQTAEEGYRSALKEELGVTQVLGTHEIANVPVDLLETFVSLHISAASEADSERDPARRAIPQQDLRALTPESVLRRAFENHRMLLVLGDAGSGKTTLLKYYAMLCLKGERHGELGFKAPPLPIYFPLRDVDFEGDAPRLLHECLSKWAKKRYREIPSDTFRNWLDRHRTLVLLDGLDEISDMDKRRRVCEWIDDTAKGLGKAHFVVTSRWTGYRKLDQIQLGFGHLTAEIRDFSPEQQSQFLRKWFVAAYRRETRNETVAQAEWESRQAQRGLACAQAIIDFLALDQNKAVRELAAVPMLLQIVAIIWKEHEILPQSRAELYKTALNYLVYYRERHRHLDPPLRLDHALRVLRQSAFWMQDVVASDDVHKDALHDRIQPVIRTMKDGLSAAGYCEYLRDRAALLADCGDDCYVFRHKSFREYLAGVELVEVCKDPQRLKQTAEHLGEDWWEEPLRFFLGEADDGLFDGFMNAVFRSDVSRELDQKTYNLLLTLVGEASQRRIDSLVRCLTDRRLHENKRRYILDCLRTIGSQTAWEAIKAFSQSHPGTTTGRFAKGLLAQEFVEPVLIRDYVATVDIFTALPPSFIRPSETNAEYIHIPGGTFKYSVDGKNRSVPDLYFAQYPVTNRRYRRFIDYLAFRQPKMNEILPPEVFAKGLVDFAREEDALALYLGSDPGQWSQKLRSAYDEEKRFNGDDQPVVGVSWFDAQAYCFWVTSFEAASQELTGDRLRRTYRLPREVEWEWAAAGRAPGGGLRAYPWPAEKGKLSDKLANYQGNVGATTPVGRYPDGATPEGLMDMAGNVWEWMENRYERSTGTARSLRGGSWLYSEYDLRCSGRYCLRPELRNYVVGFRVVCSQS